MLTVLGKDVNNATWKEIVKPSEMSQEDFINTLGQLNEVRKLAEKIEKYLKEASSQFFDTDEWEAHTEYFDVIRTMSSRVFLDGELIREEMGDEWCAEHSKETEYGTIKITRRG